MNTPPLSEPDLLTALYTHTAALNELLLDSPELCRDLIHSTRVFGEAEATWGDQIYRLQKLLVELQLSEVKLNRSTS